MDWFWAAPVRETLHMVCVGYALVHLFRWVWRR